MTSGDKSAGRGRSQTSGRQRPKNKLVEFHGVDEAPRRCAEDTPLSAASHSKARTGLAAG